MKRRPVILGIIVVVLGLIVWSVWQKQGPAKMPETSATRKMKSGNSESAPAHHEDGADPEPSATNPRTRPSQPPVNKVYAKPKVDLPFASKVPGKAGFVFSPFNNKIVDVQDIPPGTLVADPTYPPEEKKYFRIPE